MALFLLSNRLIHCSFFTASTIADKLRTREITSCYLLANIKTILNKLLLHNILIDNFEWIRGAYLKNQKP